MSSKTATESRTFPYRLVHGATASLIALLSLTPQAAAAPAGNPPPEVRRMLENFLGRWSAPLLELRIGPDTARGSAEVDCEKAAGGWAVHCRATFRIAETTMKEVLILGWNAPTNTIHMFSINSSGDAHDHRGAFDGKALRMEYRHHLGGRPLIEKLGFEFRGPKELWWTIHKTVGSEPVFSGQGAFRK